MPDHLENCFTLGACEIRPGENKIVRDGNTLGVEPKSMAVLLELAARSNETVTRDEIISVVWPRGYVTDDVLNRCISQLRMALGDNPKSPTYIVTVPRKGYRLVAHMGARHETREDGVLVLPFQNLASHNRDGYLADGLTELLIARLAVAVNQRVISRTTTMSFKDKDPDISDIRSRLSVKWVVEGSLLQLGDQLQVVVQLIDTETDAHAWADTWVRPATDIMAVLNEVTRQVSTQINSRLAPIAELPLETGSFPNELMRRYLQGVYFTSRRAESSLRQALVCFQDVLDEHPGHSPALAGMALCHMLLVHYGAEPATDGIPKVRQLSEDALQIDPRNAEAMTHLAAVSFFYDWDFNTAGELAQAALSIRPNFEMAMILSANVHLVRGQYEKSQSLVDRAVLSDPLNVGLLMNAGDLLILQRRYGEAINSLSQALEMEPRMRPAWLRLALACALNRQQDESCTALDQALQLGTEDAAYIEYTALVDGLSGRLEKAAKSAGKLQELASQQTGVLPWSLARAWAAAGDPVKAVEYLEQAFKTRSSSMPFLGQSPVLSSIINLEKVRQLMIDIGIPV